MSVKRILRRMLLGLLLGGRSLFGISMSSEKSKSFCTQVISQGRRKRFRIARGERANRNNGSAEERLKCPSMSCYSTAAPGERSALPDAESPAMLPAL
jgi:hypothetical protein